MTENLVWHSPHPDLKLSCQEVHLWRAFLDQPTAILDQLKTTLSPEEQSRAQRFHFERDRHRFIAARGILRNTLSRYLNIPPENLEFCYGKRGKPALKTLTAGGKIYFNLSHSDGLALYAITRATELGIDIEENRPLSDLARLAKTIFSPSEHQEFQTLTEPEKPQAFFNAWTRKEAYLKAIGDGLYQPIDSIEVSFSPKQPAKLVKIAADETKANQWQLFHLIPHPGYTGCLALPAQNLSIHSWQWQFNPNPVIKGYL